MKRVREKSVDRAAVADAAATSKVDSVVDAAAGGAAIAGIEETAGSNAKKSICRDAA